VVRAATVLCWVDVVLGRRERPKNYCAKILRNRLDLPRLHFTVLLRFLSIS